MSKEITVIKGKDLTRDMIAADPERYRELSNGAIFDNLSKKIVKAPPNDRQPINRENASAMSNLRWDKAREAISVGMVNASPSNTTEYDAISDMSANLTILAVTGKDRTAVESFNTLMRHGGFTPGRGKNGDNNPLPAAQLNFSSEGLSQLGEMLAQMNQDK